MADEFRSGPSAGSILGCLFSALVGMPLILGAFVAGSFGDCAEGVRCHDGLLWRFLIPAIAISAGTGLIARWLINRIIRYARDRI
ncbi:hypothetical protein PX699_12245 [Sphingobium sp. H39-3-25]|uniref:hypothetical protein n=1 Tax=Sphingobium arseniciresistens TaxID=3030834 RepID=UPI0023B94649|nr:hypothetical protein [Sphingobium arseniciresistens]